jgi:hypothetical protein
LKIYQNLLQTLGATETIGFDIKVSSLQAWQNSWIQPLLCQINFHVKSSNKVTVVWLKWIIANHGFLSFWSHKTKGRVASICCRLYSWLPWNITTPVIDLDELALKGHSLITDNDTTFETGNVGFD